MKARENPFRVDRLLAVRYRPDGWTWPELTERLARLSYRAAIVGPDGSGKTTLMEDLAPRLAGRGFAARCLFLNDTCRAFDRDMLAELGPQDVVLLDGADLMGRVAWRRFRVRTSGAGGLVITSHRAGLLPTLVECRTSPELLASIAAEILGGAAPQAGRSEDWALRLFEKHRGNLRNAFRELYDVFAEA